MFALREETAVQLVVGYIVLHRLKNPKESEDERPRLRASQRMPPNFLSFSSLMEYTSNRNVTVNIAYNKTEMKIYIGAGIP